MGDAERIWREKSDEDLLDAAAELDQFTEEGRQVIRAELKRRGLEDPMEQSGEEPPPETERALECLRCRGTLRYVPPADETRPLYLWAGGGAPLMDPTGAVRVYVCPECGHVELFMDLPEVEDEEEEEKAE